MYVGGNGIGRKTLLHRGNSLTKFERGPAVPYVEQNAAFACLEQVRQQPSLLIQHRYWRVEAMRVDVAWTQFLQHQFLKRPLGAEFAEIHHHRNIGDCAGFYSTLDRSPVGPAIVGDLDADDRVSIGHRQFRRGLGVHVGYVLLLVVTGHADAADVQESQHARARAIDHGLLKLREVAAPRRAGVDHGRHADTQGEGIGKDTGIAARQVPPVRSGEDVRVQIDQPGNEVEPGKR